MLPEVSLQLTIPFTLSQVVDLTCGFSNSSYSYIDHTREDKLAVSLFVLVCFCLVCPVEQVGSPGICQMSGVSYIRVCPIAYRDDRTGTLATFYIPIPREARSLDVSV